MRQVRLGVFETNSSSTHSLTICSLEEFEDFQMGITVKNYDGEFVSIEEAIKLVTEDGGLKGDEHEDDLDNILREYDYENFLQATGNDEYEGFSSEYKTKSGEVVVAFGYYGY